MSADLAVAGLGLQYGIVRLVPAKHESTPIAEELAADIGAALPPVNYRVVKAPGQQASF